MQITLKIFRYDPEKDKKPHFDRYKVEADPHDRVLDVLEYIKGNNDGTLSFRRSCAHGICGSDAMRINGHNRLACKVLVKDLHSSRIVVEPIMGLPVVKDLIVDMEPFFKHYRSVMPFLVNDEPTPRQGRLQRPEATERGDATPKCILCACCTTSCPSFWGSDEYVGPAAIVAAHRFIFDDRDRAGGERLRILNNQFGVYRCHTIFNCTEACPREIQVTKAIGEVKRAIATGRLD